MSVCTLFTSSIKYRIWNIVLFLPTHLLILFDQCYQILILSSTISFFLVPTNATLTAKPTNFRSISFCFSIPKDQLAYYFTSLFFSWIHFIYLYTHNTYISFSFDHIYCDQLTRVHTKHLWGALTDLRFEFWHISKNTTRIRCTSITKLHMKTMPTFIPDCQIFIIIKLLLRFIYNFASLKIWLIQTPRSHIFSSIWTYLPTLNLSFCILFAFCSFHLSTWNNIKLSLPTPPSIANETFEKCLFEHFLRSPHSRSCLVFPNFSPWNTSVYTARIFYFEMKSCVIPNIPIFSKYSLYTFTLNIYLSSNRIIALIQTMTQMISIPM